MNIDHFTVNKNSTFKECLSAIDKNKHGIIFITDDQSIVVGALTDGDIRDNLLKGALPEDKIQNKYNNTFVSATENTPLEHILKRLDFDIKVIPILNQRGELVDIASQQRVPLKNEKKIYARAKAPVRVTFAGGGSDLYHYFESETGAVINATISLFCHAVLMLRDDKKIVIKSSDLNKSWDFLNFNHALDEADVDFGLFRSIIQAIKPDFGFELQVSSDFEKGSGLGGSSAVSAAIIGCFNEFRVDKWDDYDIAELAFQCERIHMKVSGGWQDQYATVFGGFNFIEFKKDKNAVQPLRINKKTLLELEESLLIYKIGSRNEYEGDDIHKDQKMTMKSDDIRDKVKNSVKLCYEMKEFLLRGKVTSFADGLNQAWMLKRQFGKIITNSEIDSIYNFAIMNGALGGKLMGAGGGGYFIFFVNPFKRTSFIDAMKQKNLEKTDFIFEKKGMQSSSYRVELDL